MSAPWRPSFGAESRMPLGSFSTVAPNARSASRWKSIGRSPMRQPPRSGMNAWPSRCRSGPQKRIGMRDAPAWASISSMCAETAPLGSSRSTPSPSSSIVTPCTSSSERTTFTSLMSGTSRSTLSVSPRRAATIALVARFFAPFTSTRPTRGRPPRIASTWPVRSVPSPPGCDAAEALRRVFIRSDLTCDSRAGLLSPGAGRRARVSGRGASAAATPLGAPRTARSSLRCAG